MIRIRQGLTPGDLRDAIARMWAISGEKILALESRWDRSEGAPVFTAAGRYTSRGWTEWTQGFQFGSALLQFEATGDSRFLELGRSRTVERMAPHVTHFGVHDHGFNNVSTYGNLHRMALAGAFQAERFELEYYALALRCSGAVQARRWTALPDGGYIPSFNGPHSLFADTMRTLRSLALAHALGQSLLEEQDRQVDLLERLVQHAATTVRFTVYYGEGRDAYDVRGRVAHESLFNPVSGAYRAPATQQGYSPFTTWTRGLAWVILGLAEQLEFVASVDDDSMSDHAAVEDMMLHAARATADFYIEEAASDGIPYWDTGAPGLSQLGDYRDRAAEPLNDFEPVDSSAAVIAAQGLCRLGQYLREHRADEDGDRYLQAGLTVAERLLDQPYLSVKTGHEGLLLHSVYHRPSGWDYIPPGRRVPCGESSMWGDYHLRELVLYLGKIVDDQHYHTFFS